MTVEAVALTVRQRKQLLALRQSRALSQDTACAVPALAAAGEGSTLVLGRLRDLGLVQSRVVRRGLLPMSGQWTEYWLTTAGMTEAELEAA